ncbi:MAG: tyrosine-protein phosphatase [Candidatus Acidiferrum sp.]
MKRPLLILSLVLASALPATLRAQTQAPAAAPSAAHFTYGKKLRIAGVPNSGMINGRLYRGAQPGERGLLELKKLGITTIVDLRAEDPARINWEEQESESLGMRFVRIPVDGWSPPTDQQVAQFLSLFLNNPQEKVFVHCEFGEDRTGVFVASYRMAFEKFPPDEALKEMYYFGFHGFWHPSMATFVESFPARLVSAPPLVSFKKCEVNLSCGGL